MEKISSNKEGLVFDISKIVAAITKAVNLLTGAAEQISDFCEEIERILNTVLHPFSQWFKRGLVSAGKKLRNNPLSHLHEAIYLMPAISTCVKYLNLVSGFVAHRFRAFYMLRTQNRGSGNSDSDYIFNLYYRVVITNKQPEVYNEFQCLY